MKKCKSADQDAFWSPYLDLSAFLAKAAPWRSIVTRGRSDLDEQKMPDEGKKTDVRKRGRQRIYEPIFVRSKVPYDEFFKNVCCDPCLLHEHMEVFLNDASKNRPAGTPVEAFLYSYIKTDRKRSYYEVLHVGSPVAIDKGTAEYDLLDFRSEQPTEVVLGIIDDGICYLNKRFRQSEEKTRFLAFWQQSLAQEIGPVSVALGDLKKIMDMNNLLGEARQKSEADIYRQENKKIYPDGLTRTAEQAASHGTHILDLAIGVDPDRPGGDPVKDVPIIGVQLPPDSIDDTSGTRLETHLLQGLRWMIFEARRNRIENLVVNVSLGILAGPKDGTKFIEQQIAWEIAKAAIPVDLGNGNISSVRVDVVLPFGSEYESRQVAELQMGNSIERSIGLKVQRDDLTPNYVEIRPYPGTDYVAELRSLEVGLVAPDGTQFAPVLPDPNRFVDISIGGTNVGRLYHVGERPGAVTGEPVKPFLALALLPTTPFVPETGTPGNPTDPGLTAPPGTWQIVVRSNRPNPFLVTLQIQRDDTAVGHTRRGRQAYFDDPTVGRWDAPDRDFTGLGDGPVRHEGTNSAYATSRRPGLHSVGSAEIRHDPVTGQADIKPARYASEGAIWTVGGPEGSALSETGRAHGGVLASGSISGSAARFIGSSTAAATFSRDLVMARLSPAGTLPGVAPAPDPARLGRSTITDNPAIRRRDA